MCHNTLIFYAPYPLCQPTHTHYAYRISFWESFPASCGRYLLVRVTTCHPCTHWTRPVTPRPDRPQHETIAESLRTAVREGIYRPGDFLPSEAELCAHFGVSRGPVRQATAALRAEGLLSSSRGRLSTVLAVPGQTTSVDTLLSTTLWLEQLGVTPGSQEEQIARHPATEEIAEKLHLHPGDPVVSVQRVRLANEVPIMIEHLTFRIEVGIHVLNTDATAGSLHRYLKDRGVKVDHVRHVMKLLAATDNDAARLNIAPGSPLLQALLHVYDHQGIPIGVADYRYRGDLVDLTMTYVRSHSVSQWGHLEM